MNTPLLSNRLLIALISLCLYATSTNAAFLYALSGDDLGVSRRLNQIDTTSQTVQTVFDLGDGTLGYFGLAYGNNKFYTIASDGSGSFSLQTFSLSGSGATNPELSLGEGFTGGLAFSGGNTLYALANDLTGAASLYTIDLLAASVSLIDSSLGFGQPGGLTWNPNKQLLYALGSNLSFEQTLYSIDPSVSGSATPVTNLLGSGIIGGVDISATGDIYAIGNESNSSELLSVTLGGNSAPLFGLSADPSFTFSALTSGPAFAIPDPSVTVPEPPTILLLAIGLLFSAGIRSKAHLRN